MKIQRKTLKYWALIAEIAGAIAIVISAVYLGVQIRANTKVRRSQADYNALSLAQRPFEMAIADQNLADLIETAYVSWEKLNEGQWFRCANYLFMQFNSWEYLYIGIGMPRFRASSGSAPTPTSKSWSKRNRV